MPSDRNETNIISSAIFGKDAQLIRVGFQVALADLRKQAGGRLPVGIALNDVKRAARASFSQVKKRAACVAILRSEGSDDEAIHRALHQALYSNYLFRPTDPANGSADRSYRDVLDKFRVRDARNKRRRYLENKILSELLFALEDGRAPSLRRSLIERLATLDILELAAQMRAPSELAIASERFTRLRDGLIAKSLGLEIIDFLKAAHFYEANHPEDCRYTTDQVMSYAQQQCFLGRKVPGVAVWKEVLITQPWERLDNSERFMPPALVEMVDPASPFAP